jgi:NADH dehydrogenase FAD-containing subunit
MSKHLILVGGGHAHMTVMLNLRTYIDRGQRVTLVGPSPYHYYSGMGPGMLSGIYRSQDVRFHVKKMVANRGAAFIQDIVTRIDPERKVLILHSGTEIKYDVVSFDLALLAWGIQPSAIFTVEIGSGREGWYFISKTISIESL